MDSSFGEIYCLTSPSGKKYIGQCVKHLSSGKKWGYINRWKEHIRDSKTKNYCRLLNNAITKYGHDNFIVELIAECDISELNNMESYYISLYNTLTPNGYNLTTGGSTTCRHSEESNNLKRKSMIGKNKGKVYEKRPRKREEDINLPKYLRYYIDKSGKEGYRVSNHPELSDRSFLSKQLSLSDKLQLAINYINKQC
jgi:group I intron endonuclease